MRKRRLLHARHRRAEVVPHLMQPYPVDEMRHLIYVSAEHPAPEGAHGHVRRLALAILTLLDLMGDDAA